MRWCYADVTPVLQGLLSELIMPSLRLSLLRLKLYAGVYETGSLLTKE